MPHFYTPGQYSIYLENFTDNISFFTFLSLFGEYIFRSSYPQLFYKKEIIKISLKFRKIYRKTLVLESPSVPDLLLIYLI